MPGEGQGRRVGEDQRAAVGQGDAAGHGTVVAGAVAELQRAAADGGQAGVGVAGRQGQQAGTELGQAPVAAAGVAQQGLADGVAVALGVDDRAARLNVGVVQALAGKTYSRPVARSRPPLKLKVAVPDALWPLDVSATAPTASVPPPRLTVPVAKPLVQPTIASQGVFTAQAPLKVQGAGAGLRHKDVAARLERTAAEVHLRQRAGAVGPRQLARDVGRSARLVPDARAAIAEHDRGPGVAADEAAGGNVDHARLPGHPAQVEGVAAGSCWKPCRR